MFAVLLLALAAPSDPMLFDPGTGFRIASYRGVIAAPPPGIARIGDQDAVALHADRRTLFLDFTPAAGATRDSATGHWRLAEPHATIPGAHWFPEAGRGNADPAIDRWLADGLHRLTHGSRRRPIIAFCLADCWMSWNAAWKARRLGYRQIIWYANGIDGWKDLGLPLTPVQPEP